MLKLAYARVKELGGDASVYGDKFFGGTHLLFVLEEKVNLYEALPARPKVASSVIFWKDLLKPFGLWEAGAGVAVSFFSRSRKHGEDRRIDRTG
jgi:hypothetical protein